MCKICQATPLIAIVMKGRLGKDEHEISRVCSPIQTIRFSWRWCQSLIQHNQYIFSDLLRNLLPLASRSESIWLGSIGSERCHKERSGHHESFKHGLSMISTCVNQENMDVHCSLHLSNNPTLYSALSSCRGRFP